jgi:formate dehydrogenase major subunit
MAQIRVNINGTEINTFTGLTILEVAKQNAISIPTLCHNSSLNNYGSCGMCVVELENSPKLIRSCSTQIQDGMVIRTDTNRIKESRKTTLELMMSDHVGDCKAPCMLNCPSNVDIQGYVGLAANKEYHEALKLIKEDLPLPGSIGRVCPHPCQTACRRNNVDDPIAIAWIKRFLADYDLAQEESYLPPIEESTGKRVAVIGGGPGGLSSAYFLRRAGHDVVVYEAMPEFGGMLKYGIPLYRLPKDILNQEIDLIRQMGVKLIPNIKIGRDITLEHIRNTFDAVYVSIGAWNSAFMRCEGSDANNIIGGIEFLNKFAINEAIRTGNRIAVIGGGNTAMDACRTSIRLGAKEVYAIYRRTKEDMPAVTIEIEEAEEEGVTFKFLLNPIEFIKDEEGNVKKIRLQKMVQGEADASGRCSVIPTDEEEILEVDSVIMSIGQRLAGEGFEKIALNERGNIAVQEENFRTNLDGVFAGGDAIGTGAGIAIQAIADGKNAAKSITEYLRGASFMYKLPVTVKKDNLPLDYFSDIAVHHRVKMEHEKPELRMHNYEEVVYGFSEGNAIEEAGRCLECGCMDVNECKLFEYANDYDAQPQRLAGEIVENEIDEMHPYFMRDPNKCILCGMCVRVCDEVMGHGILGFAHRGFEAVVKPAFNKTFQETACISCGQCVDICPTGALQERSLNDKAVPLSAVMTDSICDQCGLGCNLTFESKGSMLLKSVPRQFKSVNERVLCEKGRFELVQQQNKERLIMPLIRKNGKLEEVSWDEAMLFTAKRAQSLFLRYGENSLATVVSGGYTNEEIYLLKQLCEDSFKTEYLYASCGYKKGLKDVLGYDVSTNIVTELDRTDLIVSVGSYMMEKQPVLGIRVRKALKRGVKMIVINDNPAECDEWASEVHITENNLSLLKGIAKTLINIKGQPKQTDGYEELVASLENVVATDDAKGIAEKLMSTRNAMFVFNRKILTDDAVILLAQIAVLSGHIGRPRNGLIQLRSDGNTQGLVDLDINMHIEELIGNIESDKIKGLIVMDEDSKIVLEKKIEFLVVQENQLSDLGRMADIVLPKPTHVENNGTMTRQDRKIQHVRSAVSSPVGMTVLEQIQKIMHVFGNRNQSIDLDILMENIGKTIPEYLQAHEEEGRDIYWPVGQSRILFENGYATESGKAQLQSVGDGPMYRNIDEKVFLIEGLTEDVI